MTSGAKGLVAYLGYSFFLVALSVATTVGMVHPMAAIVGSIVLFFWILSLGGK